MTDTAQAKPARPQIKYKRPKPRRPRRELLPAEKLVIFTAIRDREIQERGDDDKVKWTPLTKRFCDCEDGIDIKTFFRYVRMVREGDVDFDALSAAATAGTSAAAVALASAQPRFDVAPKKGGTTLDLLAFIAEMSAQIEFLRSFAVGVDRAGNPLIKNPRAYTDAMSLKMRLIETATETYDKAVTYNQMSQVYQAIFDALEETAPAAIPIFLEKLNEIGKERGLVLTAPV